MKSGHRSTYAGSLNSADETDYLLPKRATLATSQNNTSAKRTDSLLAKIPPEKVINYFVLLFFILLSVAVMQWSRDILYGDKKPNIIFILTDDQGMGDMGYAGSDFEGLMPTIIALNQAGLNLSNYYSLSLCTPARSALLTGMNLFLTAI